ncbi:MAG: beta-lactamase family protein [Clostridia bacterium]|nr:beta-lactamase family protein [Clostridia bacterium]
MKNWSVYRLLLDFVPTNGQVNETTFPQPLARQIQHILRRHRCVGASLCTFDAGGVTGTLAFGQARKGVPAETDTVYRAASISKFVTALGIMRLREQGLDIDQDVNLFLPFPLRHPKAPDMPLSLRMLMTHTAGIHDGDVYNRGIAQGVPLSHILGGDSFTDHLPGTLWEYSNLGAGITGVVIEDATGTDFEVVMQRTVFDRLGVTATYYPQKVKGFLADAYRILPPHKGPNFDAGKRQQKPLPDSQPNPETHYNLAHGNLCVSVTHLARLGIAGMTPGFLTEESLQEMRKIAVPFGQRAHNLSQGLFTFVLNEPKISPHLFYGHQGMAYGAVHGLFFDPILQKGVAVLTSGASEARRGVLADINFDLLSLLLGA